MGKMVMEEGVSKAFLHQDGEKVTNKSKFKILWEQSYTTQISTCETLTKRMAEPWPVKIQYPRQANPRQGCGIYKGHL